MKQASLDLSSCDQELIHQIGAIQPDGALIADDSGIARVRVPAIEEVNPTGSGDLFLAGLTVGIERGLAPRDALVVGAACGTAGATHLRPELPPDFQPEAWTARIVLEDGHGPS